MDTPLYSSAYVKDAHGATFGNESQILKSESCQCCYCGYVFDPKVLGELDWIEELPPHERTLRCPRCGIDCVLGSASGYPIHEPEFIRICTETWFGGISRISDEMLRPIGSCSDDSMKT